MSEPLLAADLWKANEPLLPQGLGCRSGTACPRRLRDWQEAGLWERLRARLLNWRGDEGPEVIGPR